MLITSIGYSQTLQKSSSQKFGEVYMKILASKIKFPGLIMSLAVAESGFNSYDEDSFLTKSNNLWLLTKTKKCNCVMDSVTGLANYKTIDIAISDLNRRIGRLISGCKDEDQAIIVLCWYYTSNAEKSIPPSLWEKRLRLIRNDMPY